jgi:hypothetical protein
MQQPYHVLLQNLIGLTYNTAHTTKQIWEIESVCSLPHVSTLQSHLQVKQITFI